MLRNYLSQNHTIALDFGQDHKSFAVLQTNGLKKW